MIALLVLLGGCAPGQSPSPSAPASHIDPSPSASPSSPSPPAPPPCTRPTSPAAPRLLLSHEPPRCQTHCGPRLVATRDGATPLLITELQELRADQTIATILRYDPLQVVTQGGRVVLPKSGMLTEDEARFVRIFYLDGWGNERHAVHALADLPIAVPSPPRPVVACTFPEPPPAEPPSLTVEPASVETSCDEGICYVEVEVRVHNPLPTPARVVEAWTHLPGWGTTYPGRDRDEPTYVPAGGTAQLPRRVGFYKTGTHEVHVIVQDGWGRALEGTTTVTVTGSAPADEAPSSAK